jgi:hypothetical protein
MSPATRTLQLDVKQNFALDQIATDLNCDRSELIKKTIDRRLPIKINGKLITFSKAFNKPMPDNLQQKKKSHKPLQSGDRVPNRLWHCSPC